MSAKHTSGPWAVGPRGPQGSDPRPYVISPEERRTLAYVHGGIRGPADALLIAAAPELAAACEVFANIAQDGGLMKDLRDALRAHEQDAFTRACNAALAALQKAGLR